MFVFRALAVPVLAAVLALAGCADPSWGPGVVAPDPPRQQEVDLPAFPLAGHALTPRARFQVRARMLSVRHYRRGHEALLSPTDVALGWGVMSDEQVLSRLSIRQSGRWYHFSWQGSPPAPPHVMGRSSGNVHLIPATPAIARQMARLRAGDVVVLDGLLVDVDGPDGWRWRTSLSRNDAGQGSCELLWVERLAVEPAPVD